MVDATLAITTTSTTTASAITVVVVVVLLLLVTVRRMVVGAVPTGHITVAVLRVDWAHVLAVVADLALHPVFLSR